MGPIEPIARVRNILWLADFPFLERRLAVRLSVPNTSK